MHRPVAAATCVGLAAAALLMAGCARPEQAKGPGVVFYPPPPDPPRLQFLMNITSADPWITRRSSFADFIVGSRREGEDTGAIKSPYGVAAHDGKIYICDLGRFLVHVIDMVNRKYATLGESGQLQKPVNIAIEPDGTKYVCDAAKRMVAVFDAGDRLVRFLGDPGRCGPMAVAVLGDELFVADAPGGKVEVWDRQGNLKRVIGSLGDGPDQFRRPVGIAIGPQGHVFVTDQELSVIKEFEPGGRYVKSIGAPGDRPGFFARPKGIAFDPKGRLFVADAQWDKVQVFDASGQLLLFFGESTGQPHGLVTPTGVAIDATSMEAFRKYVDPGFEPEYLLLVSNQFGVNKIVVHAFGHAKGAAEPPAAPPAAEKPPVAAPAAEKAPVAAPAGARAADGL